MKIIIVVFFSTLLIACKNNKPPAASNTEVKSEVKADTISKIATTENAEEEICRLAVFFYSIGEGAEYPMIIAFEDSIGSYSQKIGKNIDYKKTPWGREGETDFCLQLTGLTTAEQDEFVANTRSQLKKAKWVNIYENYPAPNRGRK
jgi:hypothetical protein